MRFINLSLRLLSAGSAAALSATLLAGCGSWSNPIERTMDHLSPYKADIQQGNAISQDMLARLKPGMTPSQVRFVLGTPLLVDPFRNNRWDYVYRLEKGGRLIESRRVTVVFENDKLKGIEGDVVAAAKPEAKPEAKPDGEKK
ncbi:MAG: outer membrane protein assembly factor BamE [Pseudomonadota bacterium]|nr:outer membrane protein assembly factor BamE [Pseudomonadota bacterium]